MKKPYPQEVITEAKRLWMRGYTFDRITRLPQMPNRSDTIKCWADRDDWEGQLIAISRRARDKFIEKMAEEFSDEDVEQMRLLLKLSDHVERNLDHYNLIDPQNLNALANALDKAVKGRRLVTDKATEKHELSGDVKVNWENIIYATASDETEGEQQDSGSGGEGLSQEI